MTARSSTRAGCCAWPAAKPPTGFMHDIVVEDSGERKGTFDIKLGGLLPIVDLAKV